MMQELQIAEVEGIRALAALMPASATAHPERAAPLAALMQQLLALLECTTLEGQRLS